ncbi:MAG TPA: hypothetical protein VMH22_02075 [bacterium]|nr:hypothetical protein [bacterium]
MSWRRDYGGTNHDEGRSVQQTADGGYVIVGYTTSFGAGGADVYLIKTDAEGDTLWTRTYGGTRDDWGNCVQQTSDGGYIVAGWTASFGAGNRDVYLVKTNASGDTLWTRTYGGVNEDEGNSVRQTADGGYVVAGHTYSFGAEHGDVYIIKTDAQGDTLWSRIYGGSSYDEGNSVQQTTDGGYIAAGYTYSFGGGTPTTCNVYLVRTNASGDTLWTNTYGDSLDDRGSSVQQTADSGYIITGFTCSFGAGGGDVYLIKTNAQGDTLWTRTYGGRNEDEGYSVRQTADSGYIITGFTSSFGAGSGDVYLIKTNAQGDTLWTRTYGGANDDEGYSVQQTADSGYIITGCTYSFGAGGGDVYLIKTDANGNVGIEEPSTPRPAGPTRFLVQPNPFSSFARVPGHETELFALSDVAGRQVAVCKGDRVGEGLRPGVYFLSPVGSRTGRAFVQTIIKAAF